VYRRALTRLISFLVLTVETYLTETHILYSYTNSSVECPTMCARDRPIPHFAHPPHLHVVYISTSEVLLDRVMTVNNHLCSGWNRTTKLALSAVYKFAFELYCCQSGITEMIMKPTNQSIFTELLKPMSWYSEVQFKVTSHGKALFLTPVTF
jgi:hypothetical protein